MRIVFVVGSFDPGRDGVGDYVAGCCRELQARGHSASVLALNDRFTHQAAEARGDRSFDAALRLPASSPWGFRIEQAREFVLRREPDVLSLQFVPFAFESRGLPWRLRNILAQISAGRDWHVMCHELWIDRTFPLPLKQRILGRLQKPIIAGLFRQLKPRLVHTQIELYRSMLSRMHVESELLPLHGNIPVSCASAEARSWLLEQLGESHDEAFLAGFFGDLLPTLDTQALEEFVSEMNLSGKKLCILSGGRLSANGEHVWESVRDRVQLAANCHSLGPLATDEVSRYLAGLDVGLTSYPEELAGKSGAAASILEHGKAVRIVGRMRNARPGSASRQMLPDRDAKNASQTVDSLLEALARHGYAK